MSNEELTALAVGQAEEINDAGVALTRKGDFANAANTFLKGLAHFEGANSCRPVRFLVTALTGNLAKAYFHLGRIDDALQAFKEQGLIALVDNNEVAIANAENGAANCLVAKGEYALAEKLYEDRLRYATKVGDKKGEGNTLNNLANVYIQRKQFGPAIALLKKRVALAREIGDRRGLASSLMNLGELDKTQGKNDGARDYLTEALQVMRQENDPRASQLEQRLAAL